MSRPLITVVICTYNRASLLQACLQSLVEQTLAEDFYDVVVVNNNSTDATSEVIREFAALCGNFSGVVETAQGIAHARNTGWRIARGEYVAYIDDDCKAPSEWLVVAKSLIEDKRPILMGGPALPFYAVPKPLWFRDEYVQFALAGDEIRLTQPNEYFPTMNTVFRRSVLEGLGGFRTDLGMVGREIAYGEDTEIMMRMRVKFPDALIYYVPHLHVYHLARPEKMTLQWMMPQSFAAGKYSSKVFRAQALPRYDLWRAGTREVLYFCRDLCWSIFWRDRAHYPYWQNFFYEVVCRHLIKLGEIVEQLQRKPPSL